jgi:hypothetical protein
MWGDQFDPDGRWGMFDVIAKVVAVGDDLFAAGTGRSVIRRVDEWKRADSPTAASLDAVACDGKGGRVFAVGDGGSMVRGEGDRWTVVETKRADNLHDLGRDLAADCLAGLAARRTPRRCRLGRDDHHRIEQGDGGRSRSLHPLGRCRLLHDAPPRPAEHARLHHHRRRMRMRP